MRGAWVIFTVYEERLCMMGNFNRLGRRGIVFALSGGSLYFVCGVKKRGRRSSKLLLLFLLPTEKDGSLWTLSTNRYFCEAVRGTFPELLLKIKIQKIFLKIYTKCWESGSHCLALYEEYFVFTLLFTIFPPVCQFESR